jgi:hypothetical protein
MNLDKYKVIPDTKNETESVMTEDKKELSNTQFKYYEQVQPPWEDFADEKFDKNFVRKSPSFEAVKTMNQSLEDLGQLFEGCDFNWHLDGALNISLMNGAGENEEKYIGEHKDVDISFEKKDFKAIEIQLFKNGYGFFLSRTEDKNGNKIMKQVGYKKAVESDMKNILVAAVDDKGKIRRDKDLNFIDVHIIERDEEGKSLGVVATSIPEKWSKLKPFDFHGREINISHPGKVLYYKLHQGRKYDLTDAQSLVETGKISKEDIGDIEKVFEDEFKAVIEHGRKLFEVIVKQIKPEMNSEEVFAMMKNQPEFKKREDMTEGLRTLAEKIIEAEDKSLDGILDIAINLFKIEEKNNQKLQELREIGKRVEELNKRKLISNALKK